MRRTQPPLEYVNILTNVYSSHLFFEKESPINPRKGKPPPKRKNDLPSFSQRHGEPLLVFCWCMKEKKKIDASAIANGETFSCGEKECKPKTYVKGE